MLIIRTSTASVRALLWRQPTAWAVVIGGAAWVALAVTTMRHGDPFETPDTAAAFGAIVGHSVVMAVAMMTPTVLAPLHHVAVASLWPRRYRAPALCWSAYIGVWTVVATGLLLVTQLGARVAGVEAVQGASAGVAVGAYLSPRRVRRLRACTFTRPLPPRGRRADRACLGYGAQLATRCVATCWGPMLFATATHGLSSMVAITGLGVLERSQRRLTSRRRAWYAVAIALLLALDLATRSTNADTSHSH